jgi:REP element-mobilizing transposase RayT
MAQRSKVELYVHLVWGTRERAATLVGQIEWNAYDAIRRRCSELGCPAHAIGGMADHVHVLATLHPAIAVAKLAGEVKGLSSHQSKGTLAWQGGYAAYSVSCDDVETVQRYVLDQKAHHAAHRLLDALELPGD